MNNAYILCGTAYELGCIYFDKKEYDKSLEQEVKAIEIARSIEDNTTEIFGMNMIAEIYLNGFQDYRKAEEYANKALHLAEKYDLPSYLISSKLTLSYIYLKQQRYKEAEHQATLAYEMDTVDLNKAMKSTSNIVLANIFLGNKTKASQFFEKYMNYVKQFNDESLHQSLSDMEIKYETEKKEARIDEMEQERTFYIWLSIAGGTLLLSLLVLFIILHRLAVNKRKLAEAQIQQVATQSVLDGETAERTRLARDLHDGLGGMLSVVKLNLDNVEHLENARDLLDQSINELRRVAHHLMPESLLRYGLKASLEDFIHSVPNAQFHYFGEDNRLDNRTEILIYRCVHELVNNALKYAKATTINVQLVQDSDRISLAVQDDGCGYDMESVTSGMGLKNLRDRVTAANGKLNVYSSPDKGTEVDVEVALTQSTR